MKHRLNFLYLLMRGRSLLILLLLFATLSGCARHLPPYRPYSDGVGYQDRRVEQNRFTVSFTGNSSMDVASTENYLLFRAAELTNRVGFDYFILHDKKTQQLSRARYFPQQRFYGGFGRFGYYGGYYGYWNSPFAYDYYDYCCLYNWYEVSAEVLMYAGEKPADNHDAYVADEVLQFLNPSIRRPAPTSDTTQ